MGHDLAIDCASVDQFSKSLGEHVGTVETGLGKAWPVLRRAIPGCRMVVVRRDVGDVLKSLEAQGVTGVESDIEERADALDRLSSRRGVFTIQYRSLADSSVCAWLFQYCLGVAYDHGWWSALDAVNIQIDLQKELERVAANADRIARFKAEVKRRLPAEEPYTGAIISAEPFGSLYPECLDLAKEHFSEVEVDTDPRRVLDLDRVLLSAASVQGSLRTFAARVDTKLVGYLFWTMMRDPESTGLVIADQGPWYVKADAPKGTAIRLYDRSLADLKAVGVKNAYPHHRLHGRGSGLGKFFERRGAVPEKQVYSLWIGD